MPQPAQAISKRGGGAHDGEVMKVVEINVDCLMIAKGVVAFRLQATGYSQSRSLWP
jgi:hypothetical protein